MQPILEIQEVSKKFHIHHEREAYLSLRDSIASLFRRSASPVGWVENEEFWALKDVSFNVQPGDSIGILGKNGAGKSTLLKILSRITPPTRGKIISRGRIASLLEVGTGFHPELTGRENVFLNGSILGMRQKEILAKFDEIVDFSGVVKFIDTPLKHYSSGMQMRLAFAVAAFLEPEILLIDEVLAVGDFIFQKKCIEKMTEICHQGKTILFVSHNFQSLKSLCKNGVLLENGSVKFNGDIHHAINTYSSISKIAGHEIHLRDVKREVRGNYYLPELLVHQLNFKSNKNFSGTKMEFSLILQNTKPGKEFTDIDFGINIYDENNVCLVHLSNRFIGKEFHIKEEGQSIFEFSFDNNLKPGNYSMGIWLNANHYVQDVIPNIIEFTIEDGNPYGFYDTKSIQGTFFPPFDIQKVN